MTVLCGDGAMSSLFDEVVQRPLAEMLRPQRLSEVVGQDHLLAPDGPIGRMIKWRKVSSFILWGPPGVGKTTIARLVAKEVRLDFVQLLAVLSGVAELRKVVEAARKLRSGAGRQTVVFVDELHRFNRTTQDALLPHVEDGTIVLIGATTENPSFSLVAALLSRVKVYTLRQFEKKDLAILAERSEVRTGKKLPLDEPARDMLFTMADGDGRYLIGLCEELFSLPAGTELDVSGLAKAVQKRAPIYDKGHEERYNLLSCFHKSLRGSDVQAALYWGARMIVGGEDPGTIFRRLACAASEDVGMADPQALQQVITAWMAFERVGWPEGCLFMAQAITYVATAPKSNASYMGFNKAIAIAQQTGSLAPPKHILNAPTKLMKELGYHEGYRYDHDYPNAFSGQEFMPDELAGPNRPDFYVPNELGFERDIKKRLDFWNKRRHNQGD